jgi:hypothetical protein
VVLHADPGMENHHTYDYVARMMALARRAGIECATAPGPNLAHDLISLKRTGRTRVDNPPYWTRKESGKVGQLLQKCTKHYKIAPMDRWLRIYIERELGYGRTSKRLPAGLVEKWIGFSASEAHRVKIKPSQQQYITFRYPLIELGWGDAEVAALFDELGEEPPPRSVCNACFANSGATFQEMRTERPGDFEQACQVDDAIRDLSQIGVEEQCYVAKACKPLRELGSDGAGGEEWSCDSGYCFL